MANVSSLTFLRRDLYSRSVWEFLFLFSSFRIKKKKMGEEDVGETNVFEARG